MATAEKITSEARIHLDLSEAEAKTLFAVLSAVGGSPDLSPRKHTKAVRDALSGALDFHWTADAHESAFLRGTIHFANYR